ncbi:MAG: BMC domain-containing protein [Planctomycetaceae bacterium]|nr:BMC domain-containing protein [Planctomycetaceae bacterium]
MEALGMVELSSIAVAYLVEDAMLKASEVELLVARTICSGKYIVMVGGPVAAVEASLRAGREASREALIDELFIPNIDERVFPAITGSVALKDKDKDALGILEAFSVTSIIEGADAAVKAADVTLFRIHVAMAIGGKGFLLLTGEVSDVTAAIEAGAKQIGRRGLLVSKVVIPRPDERLFKETL